jgi:hypothetical protein
MITGLVCSACRSLEPECADDFDSDWIKKLTIDNPFEVQQIFKIGEGIENKCQGLSAQGVIVKDHVMYRLYDSGLCQTFDLSDITKPVKIASFELGSHKYSNHANCAQGFVDENGDLLIYVSGIYGGKTYVERITTTGSNLIQTITLPEMDFLDRTTALNAVCSDDGDLWFFGSGGTNLLFARARKPFIGEGDVTLISDDIFDFWAEDGYVYDDDVWQGGKVYNGLLFMLFGSRNSKRHLAIYDTRSHVRITDIDFSDTILEEPEDCEIISEGILIVTNGGNHFYLIRPRS